MMTLDLIEEIRRDEERAYKEILDSTELNYLRMKNKIPIE